MKHFHSIKGWAGDAMRRSAKNPQQQATAEDLRRYAPIADQAFTDLAALIRRLDDEDFESLEQKDAAVAKGLTSVQVLRDAMQNLIENAQEKGALKD